MPIFKAAAHLLEHPDQSGRACAPPRYGFQPATISWLQPFRLSAFQPKCCPNPTGCWLATGESGALDATKCCPKPTGEVASGMQLGARGTTKVVIPGAESPTRNVGRVSQIPYTKWIRWVSRSLTPNKNWSGFQPCWQRLSPNACWNSSPRGWRSSLLHGNRGLTWGR